RPRELVRSKPTDSLLAEHPSSPLREPGTIASLRRTRRFHPVTQENVEAHAMSVVAEGDAAVAPRDTAELDAHRGGVRVVSVLDELNDGEDLVADQLGPDELEEPGTWSELDHPGLQSLSHSLCPFSSNRKKLFAIVSAVTGGTALPIWVHWSDREPQNAYS